jgi:hypothetical protein|tara:strand:+ start:626 stop:799 length:174 start_codon:yes stop_codon:yes gene_type:complete
MEKEKILTNEKETKRAIKAAVDQAKKVKKIPDEYWVGTNFKKGIDLYWKKRKKFSKG